MFLNMHFITQLQNRLSGSVRSTEHMLATTLALMGFIGVIVASEIPNLLASQNILFEICYDGIDNNDNGYLDCDDEACFQDRFCLVEICDDGLDNDRDLRFDCDDKDCVEDEACTGTSDDADSSGFLQRTIKGIRSGLVSLTQW